MSWMKNCKNILGFSVVLAYSFCVFVYFHVLQRRNFDNCYLLYRSMSYKTPETEKSLSALRFLNLKAFFKSICSPRVFNRRIKWMEKNMIFLSLSWYHFKLFFTLFGSIQKSKKKYLQIFFNIQWKKRPGKKIKTVNLRPY